MSKRKCRSRKVEVYYDQNAIKNNDKKVYIGSTEDVFLKRFYNHTRSFI